MTRWRFLHGLNRFRMYYRDMHPSGKAALESVRYKHGWVLYGLTGRYRIQFSNVVFTVGNYIIKLPLKYRPRGIPGDIFNKYNKGA